ncbi:hypothetical protein [Streptomyces sp. NPDC051214]|uniref:hypothetical protein n=1 Tax=Streptomyces sp. NPDC051214 TaxID=3155282 RepID=UPI00342E7675
MRRMCGAACLTLGLIMVSGCSPADLPLIAVRNGNDGQPVVDLRPCEEGETLSEAHLVSWTPEKGEATNDGKDSGWGAGAVKTHGSGVFPLFSPPPAWHARPHGTQELMSGRTYSLSFKGSGSYQAHVYFTADDLASLRPGQVWADDRAMSTEDFAELVDDKC